MYEIQETVEAMDDLTNLAIYIFNEFSDEKAAEMIIDAYADQLEILQIFPNAYGGTEFGFRDYLIRKCPCGNTNIFYVVDDNNRQIIVLRVLHILQEWGRILHSNNEYHFMD